MNDCRFLYRILILLLLLCSACDHSACVHSACDHSTCVHSACDHSACDHYWIGAGFDGTHHLIYFNYVHDCRFLYRIFFYYCCCVQTVLPVTTQPVTTQPVTTQPHVTTQPPVVTVRITWCVSFMCMLVVFLYYIFIYVCVILMLCSDSVEPATAKLNSLWRNYSPISTGHCHGSTRRRRLYFCSLHTLLQEKRPENGRVPSLRSMVYIGVWS